MANTLAVRIEATILDGLNVQAETSAYASVDPTASFATVLAEVNTWLADLDACTDGQIIGVELEVLPTLPTGLKSVPAPTSRVEVGGIINFNAAGDTHLYGFPIPALATACITGGTVIVTPGSPVQTLGALLAGGGTPSLTWTNYASQALNAAVNAVLSFRYSGRQLDRNSYERA